MMQLEVQMKQMTLMHISHRIPSVFVLQSKNVQLPKSVTKRSRGFIYAKFVTNNVQEKTT